MTPFAKEELDIVERRLNDVERMVGDGDLAEALGMAHQAKQSLDTIAGELEAAINDDPKSKWADATQDALLKTYEAQIDALCNGETILHGDTLAYDYFYSHASELYDGTHPDSHVEM